MPAAAAVEMEQAARAALARGSLRDQFLWQPIVKVIETHPDDYTFRSRGALSRQAAGSAGLAAARFAWMAASTLSAVAGNVVMRTPTAS